VILVRKKSSEVGRWNAEGGKKEGGKLRRWEAEKVRRWDWKWKVGVGISRLRIEMAKCMVHKS
jgi:hypothetical protein